MKGTKQTEWHFDLQMNNLLLLLYLPRPQGQVRILMIQNWHNYYNPLNDS